ncbi:hypothetical protein CYMTET_6541 [Cymbomonas tetramitiformis]|uniref:Uncharacterized protein n=1 Tax=Cymbomonas tetramitiformis TaxID=36881 RepID=A0AAE0GXD5_9CHLO|nr:hypothetical protein CYMTET_6541 [Cymbomonas tetramitiformis]
MEEAAPEVEVVVMEEAEAGAEVMEEAEVGGGGGGGGGCGGGGDGGGREGGSGGDAGGGGVEGDGGGGEFESAHGSRAASVLRRRVSCEPSFAQRFNAQSSLAYSTFSPVNSTFLAILPFTVPSGDCSMATITIESTLSTSVPAYMGSSSVQRRRSVEVKSRLAVWNLRFSWTYSKTVKREDRVRSVVKVLWAI